MARHRPALLGEAHHVERGAAPAVEMGRHAEHRGGGHDAGAADAGEHDAIGSIKRWKCRFSERFGPLGCSFRTPQTAALDGHEARAEAVDT